MTRIRNVNRAKRETPQDQDSDDRRTVDQEDQRYFDLRYFPEPASGQSGVQARLLQVAAIKARGAANDTIAYQIKARSKTGFADGAASVGADLKYSFAQLVPTRPYCTNSLSDGLVIRKREIALKKKYVQLNPPGLVRWIAHDLDYPTGGSFAYRDANLPPPNVVVINRQNGHAHGIVLLETPVATHSGGRAKPLAFLAAVERGMARRLGADRNYSGLIAKNPLHSDWAVEWTRDQPYTLQELDDCLFEADKRPDRSEREHGFGRNVTCFNRLRIYSYGEVLKAKRAGQSVGEFLTQLENVAQKINVQFSPPLPPGEIKSIAKSVCGWTWKRFSVEKLKLRQSDLGRRGAAKRWSGHVSTETSQPWKAEGISRSTFYRRRKLLRARAPAPIGRGL